MSNRIHLNTTHSETHFVEVGYDLFLSIKSYLSSEFSLDKAVLIVDENVQKLYSESFIKDLKNLFSEAVLCVIPQGEQSKSIEQYSVILDEILTSGVERRTPVVVVGGGVTGDLGGFIASSCLRGMPLIHIPTSLLAMVDSSIGGKTGINSTVGKNLIGAFYNPNAVFTDLKFLETLPHKELINGLAEVIKYGMISDKEILNDIRLLNIGKGFVFSDLWAKLVHKCVGIKADIVEKDFKEAGLREFLNFGHTFAHVIERVGSYKTHSHGEAVYMGMWGAVEASNLSGFNIDGANLDAFRSLYTSKFNPEESIEKLVQLMKKDKKVKDGEVKLVLLKDLEQPYAKKVEDPNIIIKAWEKIIGEFN